MQLLPPLPDRTMVMKLACAINEHIVADRELGALQIWHETLELGDEYTSLVWSLLTTPVRDRIRELNGRKS